MVGRGPRWAGAVEAGTYTYLMRHMSVIAKVRVGNVGVLLGPIAATCKGLVGIFIAAEPASCSLTGVEETSAVAVSVACAVGLITSTV